MLIIYNFEELFYPDFDNNPESFYGLSILAVKKDDLNEMLDAEIDNEEKLDIIHDKAASEDLVVLYDNLNEYELNILMKAYAEKYNIEFNIL